MSSNWNAEALSAGDPEEWASFYERVADRALRIAEAITGDLATAEDILHESLEVVRAGLRNGKFNPDLSPVDTWLYGIVRNKSLKHLKEQTNLQNLPPESPPTREVQVDLDARKAVVIIDHFMKAQPEIIQRLMEARTHGRVSYEDLARQFDMSKRQVQRRLETTRDRLRQHLRRHGINWEDFR